MNEPTLGDVQGLLHDLAHEAQSGQSHEEVCAYAREMIAWLVVQRLRSLDHPDPEIVKRALREDEAPAPPDSDEIYRRTHLSAALAHSGPGVRHEDRREAHEVEREDEPESGFRVGAEPLHTDTLDGPRRRAERRRVLGLEPLEPQE
jgi:hypothetical protein